MDTTAITSLLNAANSFISGNILIYVLIGAGILFTLRSGFIQFRLFGYAAKSLVKSRQVDRDHISSFQAFCTSLAARVGTGNLAGVAAALSVGGPGAIFWMWLIALLGMATSCIENTLAQIYKTNDHDGTYRGGPAYYIEKGLGQRWLSIIFSICLVITFGFAFNAIQSKSIAEAVETAFNIDQKYMGLVIAVVASMIIFGGIRSIARFAEVVVPFMALAYIVVALGVVAFNAAELPKVFSLIISHAFGLESAIGGGMGYAVKSAIQQGVQRGLFSNEAGLGSSPNAAATATPYPHHPATQGLISMVGVFVDTIIICSATAFIILLSGQLDPSSQMEGITLTQSALHTHVGDFGPIFVAIAILLFAFTSIITNYYYGETNLMLMKQNKLLLMFYRLLVLAILIVGPVAELPVLFSFADVSMSAMALVNLVTLLLLSGIVLKVVKDFKEQVKMGVEPVFDRKKFPFLDKTMDKDVWDDTSK
ncbi:alanine:cation symporter family protein [Zooshikella marina]|uniref:alanine/glycine:cation symporter family protein n=1 Tax=Zooshikella ganghwensis TaxID=202772 RepID=UPI001BAF8988|nr:alanine/glycine:cation symporter family protein [Zooshikella ganghwensis]MBU2707466.1 alanine:cation symporter family protein [Zooshikella ganghwensis]